MEEVLVKQLFPGTRVLSGPPDQVSGWVRTIRVSKALVLSNSMTALFSTTLQIVFDDSLPNFQEIAKLPIATALRIEGEVVESPGAKQPWEIKSDQIT